MKNLKDKKISIVIVPEKSTRIRRLNISYLTLYLVISVLLVGLGAIGFVIFNYHHLQEENKAINNLTMENQMLYAEHKSMKSEIRSISNELEELRNLDARIRMMIGLSVQEDPFSAMGGPDEENIDEAFDLNNSNQLARLKEIREKIIADARYNVQEQEKSMVKLKDYMESQQSLLSSTPSIWPVKGFISSGFGPRKSPFTGRLTMHEGIDIAGPDGSAILATADGVITRSEYNKYGYGNLIEINHGYGYSTKYGHLKKRVVKIGDKVKRGQVIGYRGNTGRSKGTHLHYEVSINNVPVNPLNYIVDYNLR